MKTLKDVIKSLGSKGYEVDEDSIGIKAGNSILEFEVYGADGIRKSWAQVLDDDGFDSTATEKIVVEDHVIKVYRAGGETVLNYPSGRELTEWLVK